MAGTLKVGGKVLATHNSETDEISLASDTNIKSALNASGDAPIYACRAWVNFDGNNAFSPNPSTSAIYDSGNVSSINYNGTGYYTINFTTAMPDANYAVVITGEDTSPGLGNAARGSQVRFDGRAAGSVAVENWGWYGSAQDIEMSVVIIH